MRSLRRVIPWISGVLVLAVAGFLAATWASDKRVEQLATRWAPPPSTFPAIAGLRVHLRDEGPREDPLPIVLLHGTSSSLHTWEGWAAALRPTRRVIRMDLPGFGLTGPEPQGDYSITNYVRFVRAVLDSLHVRRAVLAGNSLGGAIAWAVALDAPERVAQLVLVDAGGYPDNSTAVPIGFRIARSPVFGWLARYSLPRSVVESSVRSVFGDPSRVTPELVDRYYDLTLRAGNRRAVVERFKQPPADSLIGRLSELRVPTLILWGGRDRLISPANAERFHHDIAGSRVVMFPGLGHIPQEEDPEATVGALGTFLREQSATGRRTERESGGKLHAIVFVNPPDIDGEIPLRVRRVEDVAELRAPDNLRGLVRRSRVYLLCERLVYAVYDRQEFKILCTQLRLAECPQGA